MSNLRGFLTKAHNQFLIDLKQDKDFIEYKAKANNNPGDYSYGTLIAGGRSFLLDKLMDNNIIPTTHLDEYKQC